ncbi:MAG: methyltransferase domain-containing protein [Proteobacteria bacterium]|nr:methyltransferase domain-containing protein [Pseudomonadota bacterium]
MIRPLAHDLKGFYSSPLGALACRTLRRRIREFWPDVVMNKQQHIEEVLVGFGYATPYLIPFMTTPDHVARSRAIALMPTLQGVTPWPVAAKNRTAEIATNELPLADCSVDRLLVVHALEASERPSQMLRELWRVLKPGGRMLVIVPNRASLWAQRDNTPFGYGRPFSKGQLLGLLDSAMFTTLNVGHGLYMLPVKNRLFLKTAPLFEYLGSRTADALGGVTLCEVEKRLYATPATAEGKTQKLAEA